MKLVYFLTLLQLSLSKVTIIDDAATPHLLKIKNSKLYFYHRNYITVNVTKNSNNFFQLETVKHKEKVVIFSTSTHFGIDLEHVDRFCLKKCNKTKKDKYRIKKPLLHVPQITFLIHNCSKMDSTCPRKKKNKTKGHRSNSRRREIDESDKKNEATTETKAHLDKQKNLPTDKNVTNSEPKKLSWWAWLWQKVSTFFTNIHNTVWGIQTNTTDNVPAPSNNSKVQRETLKDSAINTSTETTQNTKTNETTPSGSQNISSNDPMISDENSKSKKNSTDFQEQKITPPKFLDKLEIQSNSTSDQTPAGFTFDWNIWIKIKNFFITYGWAVALGIAIIIVFVLSIYWCKQVTAKKEYSF